MRTRSATVLFRNVSLRKKRPKRPNHRSRPADGSISNHIFSGQTICPYDADTCFERNQISRHPESGKLQGNSGIPLSGVFGLKSGKMLLILSGRPTPHPEKFLRTPCVAMDKIKRKIRVTLLWRIIAEQHAENLVLFRVFGHVQYHRHLPDVDYFPRLADRTGRGFRLRVRTARCLHLRNGQSPAMPQRQAIALLHGADHRT